jgi:hypothetical protein
MFPLLNLLEEEEEEEEERRRRRRRRGAEHLNYPKESLSLRFRDSKTSIVHLLGKRKKKDSHLKGGKSC